MHRESSPWSAPAGRRHDPGHADEGDYIRRHEAGHAPGGSGGHRSDRGSNYGDWRGDRGREAEPYRGAGARWSDAPDRFAEPGDRWAGESEGHGGQDVPGRYQGGYRGGYGQGDQGAGGFQGSPQRSRHAGYPGMHEDPYAGASESGSYGGPYTGHQGGRTRPRNPSYGRWDEPGQNARHGDSRQDDRHPGFSGEAWADRDWQHDHPQQDARHHDPDYHQWRTEQMRRLDEDYRLWRQDRYKKFTEDFDTWRSQRDQQRRDAGSAGQPGGTSDTQQAEPQSHSPTHPQPVQQQQGGAGQASVGAGPGDRWQVSGIAGERGAQNASPHEAGQDPEPPAATAQRDAAPQTVQRQKPAEEGGLGGSR